MSMLGRMNPIVFQLCYPDPPLRSNKRLRHRRDPDAGQPTLKSWVDGITVGTKAHPGAGLLHDDSWVWTRRMWCEIAYSPNEPMQLTVEIREVAGG